MWITLIAQLLGSAAAEAASKMDREEAMALIKSVSDSYGKIDIPKAQALFLQKNPDTKLAGIKDDPTYRGQQNAADAQLNDVINSGGLTLSDRAALNSVRNRVSRGESAGRNAIERNQQARGALDSGGTLAMELQNNQQAAQQASEEGERTAGMAQARAFAAIKERAQQAGQGLDRDYRQKSDAARAQDAINAGNTAIANTAQRYNAGLPQQDFENKMRLTAAKSGATYATAGATAANAKDTEQRIQGQANMAGQALNSGYQEYKAGKAGGGVTNLGQPDNGSDTVTVNVPADFQAQEAAASSGALTGESTRPQRVKEVVGFDENGKPIYGYRTAA